MRSIVFTSPFSIHKRRPSLKNYTYNGYASTIDDMEYYIEREGIDINRVYVAQVKELYTNNVGFELYLKN